MSTLAVERPTLAVGRPSVRQMLNKVPEVTVYFWIIKILCTLIEAVRKRAAAGPAKFRLLIPNPDDHLVFDRNSRDVHQGEQVLAIAVPLLSEAAGAEVEGRVATSPNAYDDIVEELDARAYDEVTLATLPSHVSHWLHIDLPSRVAELGYPLTTVTPAHEREAFVA